MDTLFHVEEPTPAAPAENLSAGRRRTARQHALAEAGWHPLTGTRSEPERGTCGTCWHRQILSHHGKTYAKCDEWDGQFQTHGAATDVRANWPACERYSGGDQRLSPDAARWQPGAEECSQ